MRYSNLLSAFAGVIFCVSVFGQTPAKKADAEHDTKNLSFEERLLAEMNSARTEPDKYLKKLEHRKTLISGRILKLPGRPLFQMNEGISAVDGAIEALRSTAPLDELEVSKGLTKVARAQLNDLIEDPSLGHYGKDGSDLTKRLNKFGVPGKSGENITNWEDTPEDVTLALLIDDGVPGRHHRENVLNPKFQLFGAACGKVNDSKFVCVAVFADKFVEGARKPSSY